MPNAVLILVQFNRLPGVFSRGVHDAQTVSANTGSERS